MPQYTMQDIRTNVSSPNRIELLPGDTTTINDILSPDLMADNIIRALDTITAPPEKGGHGRKIIVTAARSNHHVDGALGPHGHNPGPGKPGWSVDFVPCDADNQRLENEQKTVQLILELISENSHVTKVGCPARYATRNDLQQRAAARGVVLFTDEGTGPHIHIQSA